MKTSEATHLIYSVSDNVTSSHYVLHHGQQVALEQRIQPRLGMTQLRQRLDGLKTETFKNTHLKQAPLCFPLPVLQQQSSLL